MEAYDPVTDRWITRARMPTGRRAFLVGRLNGRFQAMGGEATGTGSGTYAENEEYDPSTDTWKPIQPMPLPRHGGVAATVDGWVYTVGGGPASGSSYSAVNDVFAF